MNSRCYRARVMVELDGPIGHTAPRGCQPPAWLCSFERCGSFDKMRSGDVPSAKQVGPGLNFKRPESRMSCLPPRIFLLSPARLDGKRAQLLFHPMTMFPAARALRSSTGAPIGEIFTF